MVIRGRITLESQNFGLLIWISQSRRIKSQSVWLYSKSAGLRKRRVTEVETDTQMVSRIWLWEPNYLPPTLTSSMPIRPVHNSKIWCDICKLRWGKVGGTWHTLAMTPARWEVISETHERKGRVKHYCQPCANDAQTRHDGTIWTFKEQLEYAIGQEKIDGMESK